MSIKNSNTKRLKTICSVTCIVLAMGGLAQATILDVSLSCNPIAAETWTALTVTTSEDVVQIQIFITWPPEGATLTPDGSGVCSFDIKRSFYTGIRTIDVTSYVSYEGSLQEDDYESIPLVVYDPDAGFITGAGSIDSPPGAYVDDPSLTGMARFAFISKYTKGKTTPTGHTEFMLKAGDLSFQSCSYDWLVVKPAYAKFKGSGTINGEGDYKFMVWAKDEPDTFRISIWKEEDDDEITVYDNGEGGQAIESGNIIVHEGDSDSLCLPPCDGTGGGGAGI